MKEALMTLATIPIVVVCLFLWGVIVELSWNGTMPDIFGLPAITYWQAFGLSCLSYSLMPVRYYGILKTGE